MNCRPEDIDRIREAIKTLQVAMDRLARTASKADETRPDYYAVLRDDVGLNAVLNNIPGMVAGCSGTRALSRPTPEP